MFLIKIYTIKLAFNFDSQLIKVIIKESSDRGPSWESHFVLEGD